MKFLMTLFLIWAIFLCSCNNKKVGDYFYDDGELYHIDISCNDKEKSFVYAHDAYTNLHKVMEEYRYGHWAGYQRVVHFCANCISEKQMKQIADSIIKYDEN